MDSSIFNSSSIMRHDLQVAWRQAGYIGAMIGCWVAGVLQAAMPPESAFVDDIAIQQGIANFSCQLHAGKGCVFALTL